MRYRFTDTWASVVVGAGWIVFMGSVFAGIAHGIAREAGIVGAHPFTRFNARVEELFVFLACALAGFLVGGALIALGQLLHVMLDIRHSVIGLHSDLQSVSRPERDSRGEGRWSERSAL
jgi:hypothetical protein